MEFVRMTVFVVAGSDEGGFEMDGAGLALSCARAGLGGATNAAKINA